MKKIIAKLFFFTYTYLYILFIIAVEMDKKDKKIFKWRYLVYFIIAVSSLIVSAIIIIVLFKYSNIDGKFDHVALLSVNVGILQGLTGLIGIGLAGLAFFNFNTTRKQLKKLKREIKTQKDSVDELRQIVGNIYQPKNNDDINKKSEQMKPLLNENNIKEWKDETSKE